MKIYEIIDDEEKLSIGCLIYYEREKSFIIELQEYLDEWTAPLIFAQGVKNGKLTIGRELSLAWVKERIVPSDRQNIDSILANAKMSEYDEMTLLEKTSGKCSQDSMYIKKIGDVPGYVKKRMQHTLLECVPCDDYSLLCFFCDGMVKKIKIKDIGFGTTEINKITLNDAVFKSCHIAAGGYCVTFNDAIDIDASVLYQSGTEVELQLSDFINFVKLNIVDSTECCNILECSRQNLTNYLSKDTLTPIKDPVKGKLFTKGNVYRAKA